MESVVESLAPASEIMVIGEEMEPSTPVSGGGVGGGGETLGAKVELPTQF